MAKTVMTMPPRMSTEEWQTRLDLAACYRLVDLFGWSDLPQAVPALDRKRHGVKITPVGVEVPRG